MGSRKIVVQITREKGFMIGPQGNMLERKTKGKTITRNLYSTDTSRLLLLVAELLDSITIMPLRCVLGWRFGKQKNSGLGVGRECRALHLSGGVFEVAGYRRKNLGMVRYGLAVIMRWPPSCNYRTNHQQKC